MARAEARNAGMSEAQLDDALEVLSVAGAEAVLSQLAGAVFPSGVGDLTQLTWSEPQTAARSGSGRRERVDARLRTAELRYRTLIEQIPAVTFMAVLGEGDNEVYVSPHIESLLGFTQTEWLENPFLWYTQLHPDDRDTWHREFARGCRTGGPFRADCRFIARDGRVVWVHGEARLVKDPLGRPLFLQGVAFDITDAKRAEELLLREAVRTTEERYRDLVEQVGAIFVEAAVDKPGFTFVSRGTEPLLGHSPENWLNDPDAWLRCVHESDRAEAARAWADARTQRGGTRTFEYRAFRTDGTQIWLQQKVHVFEPATGDRRVLGFISDISDRKRAEDVLRANEARLRSEADIRQTLHRIGTALAGQLELEKVVQLATDEATVLTTAEFGAFFYNVVNEVGESYMLYTLSGAPREAFANFPMPRNTALFGPTFRGEQPLRIGDVRSDPRFGRSAPHYGLPPGHLPVRSYLAVPVVSSSGHVLGGLFFGHSQPNVFTDEHEQLAAGIAGWTAVAIENARLYRAAEAARASAEAANRAKDEFLAMMSHELRTPLNAILGWSTILRAKGRDEEVRQRAITTIERNARAQVQIIEDLLDVSRIVSGKLTVQKEPVNLVPIVTAAIDAIRLAAESRRIHLLRRLDEPFVVHGDATRLQQIVSNLLSNAVKFTPSGGWVEVRLEPSGDRVRITIEDNGQGIAPEFLPHIFEPFRQADGSSTRVHGGLGLGLAIVQRLVQLHDGTVRAFSRGLGYGSRFTVDLPVVAAAQDDASHDAPPAVETPAPHLLQDVRVLVVDDEADSRELMIYLLEQAGADVTSAASAAEALQVVEELLPDVLISDVGMPYQDGYELMRTLRSRSSAIASVPSIAVTAYARAEDRERAHAAGFQAHLAKPVTAPELIEAVRRLSSEKPL